MGWECYCTLVCHSGHFKRLATYLSPHATFSFTLMFNLTIIHHHGDIVATPHKLNYG